MNKKEIYKEGIRQQKAMGWTFVVVGGIFTMTIIGAPFGIPMVIFGIIFINANEVNAITAEMIRKKITQ